MTAERAGGERRKRRYLTAEEKYQVWLEVVTGQGTEGEIADRWGVDRSTVAGIVKTAREAATAGFGGVPAGPVVEDPGAGSVGGHPSGDRPGCGRRSPPRRSSCICSEGEERWG